MVVSMVTSFVTDTVYTVRRLSLLTPPVPLGLLLTPRHAQLRHMNYRQLLQQLISLGTPASDRGKRAWPKLTLAQALSSRPR